MIKNLVSVLFFLILSLTPAVFNKYDVIVIPIRRGESKLTKHVVEIKNPSLELGQINKNDRYRLDIESYAEPTDVPDIDNSNYDDEKAYTEYDGGKSQVEKQPSNFGDDKIVNGEEVDINLHPYHVAYGSNCGGAIIDKRWVVTAGHCEKKSFVRVGSRYLNKGKKIMVKESHIHPFWLSKKKEHPFDYDFQVLELAEALRFDENIQPIKVGHIEDMVVGKVITVTGWGNTRENGPYSHILRAIRVPIISKERCQNVPFPYFRGTLTSRMFCAGYAEGNRDACQGDSGGPAVAYDRLLGLVSFGYGCATPGSYGVYSKIAKVRSWIQEVTRLQLE